MPTYQYACTNAECGNRFELVQTFTDPAVTQCPVCGENVRKVYGSVGVVFKGSGFYRTDSRNAKTPAAATADSGTAAKSDAAAASGDKSSSAAPTSDGKSDGKKADGRAAASSGGGRSGESAPSSNGSAGGSAGKAASSSADVKAS
jgi:putative FmdB family regulatory protein